MVGLLDEPQEFVFEAPSPLDGKKLVSFTVDVEITGKRGQQRNLNSVYQLYYNIFGMPPPVNCIGAHERNSKVKDLSRGILDAHAVFQGINRPCVDEEFHDNVYIYVVQPSFYYENISSMVCPAKRVEAPPGTVFVVYATLNESGNSGTILNWELVKADKLDCSLPENYETRYNKRRW